MEGFKPNIKMKAGGHVAKEVKKMCKGGKYKEGGSVAHDDVKEDKKLIKKAFNMHDDQLHEGERTDLAKLKKGGRCKKEGGSVRKYKAGGEVKKADGGVIPATAATVANPAAVAQARRRAAALAAMQGAGAGGIGQAANNAALAQAIPSSATFNPQAQAAAAAPQNIPMQKRGGKVKKK